MIDLVNERRSWMRSKVAERRVRYIHFLEATIGEETTQCPTRKRENAKKGKKKGTKRGGLSVWAGWARLVAWRFYPVRSIEQSKTDSSAVTENIKIIFSPVA